MKGRGVIVGLVAAAGATVLLVRGGEDPWPVSVERLAERVERIRGHRFERVPSVDVLPRRELDEEVGAFVEDDPERGRAGVLALSIAGVGTARELTRGPRLLGFAESSRRILISRELLERDPAEAEAVLAHELAHALEFERFGLDRLRWDSFVDADVARDALVEGSAMLAESAYRIRHQEARARLHPYARGLAREAGGDARGNAALTWYWNLTYSAGTRYVSALHRAGGWKAVDRALRRRPSTTAAVLHGGAGRRGVAYPPSPPPRALSRRRWKHLRGLDVGEMHTRVLARVGVTAPRAIRSAAGTVEGGVDVWETRGRCESPCRRDVAVLFAWRARDRRAARRLADTLRDGLRNRFAARPAGGALRIDDRAAAVATRGTGVRYAFAPTLREARSLAGWRGSAGIG